MMKLTRFVSPLMIIPLAISCHVGSVSLESTLTDCIDMNDLHVSKATEIEEESFIVDEDDIADYIHYLNVTKTKDNRQVTGYTPYVVNGDAVFYIIELTDGWQIISADKRGPILLAESETGRFYPMIDENSKRLIWLEGLSQDIIIRRHLDKLRKRETSEYAQEQEEASLLFWKMLKPDNSVIPFVETKSGNHPFGHWELISATYQDELFIQVDHYCTTHWHQWSPYNLKCPPRTDGQSGKMPAGCVAIAGAQVLKYLHDYWGVPDTAPAGLDEDFYGKMYSSFPWTSINYEVNPFLSYFIRDIGTRSNTDYHNDESLASVDSLVNNAFAFYGIGAEYNSYNAVGVHHSLDNSLPVIASAYGIQHNILGYTWEEKCHAFIIDGYKVYRMKVTGFYEWVWDEHTSPVPDIEYTTMITYEEPQMHFVKMNWGWGNDDDVVFDDVWYASSGTWETYFTEATDTTYYHWDYTRKYVHNYEIL